MKNQQENHAHLEDSHMSADLSPLHSAAGTMSALPVITPAEITTLLAFSPDPLILVDQEGRMVLVNTLASSLFGYHTEELVGQPLEMLLPERFRAMHQAHRRGYTAT